MSQNKLALQSIDELSNNIDNKKVCYLEMLEITINISLLIITSNRKSKKVIESYETLLTKIESVKPENWWEDC